MPALQTLRVQSGSGERAHRQIRLSWNPITWLPHLVLDAIGDGHKDVNDLTELLRWHGLEWHRPITPRPAPQVLRTDGYRPTIVGSYERAVPRLASLVVQRVRFAGGQPPCRVHVGLTGSTGSPR